MEKIYTPEDGRRLGLNGMIDDVFARVRAARQPELRVRPAQRPRPWRTSPRTHHRARGGRRRRARRPSRSARRSRRGKRAAPVIGITGTGGAGKSSLTDELLQRFVRSFPERADRRGRHGPDAAALAAARCWAIASA